MAERGEAPPPSPEPAGSAEFVRSDPGLRVGLRQRTPRDWVIFKTFIVTVNFSGPFGRAGAAGHRTAPFVVAAVLWERQFHVSRVSGSTEGARVGGCLHVGAYSLFSALLVPSKSHRAPSIDGCGIGADGRWGGNAIEAAAFLPRSSRIAGVEQECRV